MYMYRGIQESLLEDELRKSTKLSSIIDTRGSPNAVEFTSIIYAAEIEKKTVIFQYKGEIGTNI